MENGTNNYLRYHPIIASLVVVGLYYAFLIGAIFVIQLIGMMLGLTIFDVDPGVSAILETIITFAILSILFFIIIPFVLRYPKEVESFDDYLDTIRLSRTSPLKSHIFIGVIISAIIILPTFLFALPTGLWYLDFAVRQIFPPHSWSLITAIIPGFFEEVAFRGILLTIIANRYIEKKAIVGSSFVFGFAHAINYLFGADPIITTAQIGFAFFLGILFAYLFFETDSLLPVIIIHYLIGAFGQFFAYAIYAWPIDPLLKVIYMVICLGAIPMLLGLGFMKLYKKFFA